MRTTAPTRTTIAIPTTEYTARHRDPYPGSLPAGGGRQAAERLAWGTPPRNGGRGGGGGDEEAKAEAKDSGGSGGGDGGVSEDIAAFYQAKEALLKRAGR